ncbi:signal peptide peptidase SppA [Carnobacterium gallinarum]|uniref:signal peptide peptidase SppA n=1 Tax=Carnobacterium gallinarum TaxID=2749 RepID=UPI000550E2DB|nr:signal peptide peptidase SppA [Carnobacterium gallinarum]
MNKKRWAAVGIAVGLLVVSLASSYAVNLAKKEDKESTTLGDTYSMLLGEQAVSKNISQAGAANKSVVVLTVDGAILDGGTSGIFSSGGYNHADFMNQLQLVEDDDDVKGIVLVVNSPGGGTFESAEIKDKLVEIKTKTKKPLYVSMQNMAASGGYYISANADKIFATEETLTGSIGVIMSGLNYSGLYEKLGISDTTIKSGQYKDIMSQSRAMTDGDRAILQTMIDDSYGRFVNVVATGRNMDEKRARELADGRIYDGAQAKSVGLVDEIGYKEDVIKAIQKDYKLEDGQVFEYQTTSSSLSNLFFSKASQVLAPEKNTVSELSNLLEKFGTVDSPKMMYLYGGE